MTTATTATRSNLVCMGHCGKVVKVRPCGCEVCEDCGEFLCQECMDRYAMPAWLR